MQLSGQVLSQGKAGRLVIGQARGRVKSLKEPLCLIAAFEDGAVEENSKEATGETMIHIQTRAGRPRTRREERFLLTLAVPPPPSAWAIAHTLLAASFCIKRPYQQHLNMLPERQPREACRRRPPPGARRCHKNLGSREMRVEATRRGFVLAMNAIGYKAFKGVMECSDLVTTLKRNTLIQSPDAPSQQPTVPDGASQTHTPSQGGIRLELPPQRCKVFSVHYPFRLESPMYLSLVVESVARLLNRGQPLLRRHFVLMEDSIDTHQSIINPQHSQRKPSGID